MPSMCKTIDYGYDDEPDKLVGRMGLSKEIDQEDSNLWKIAFNKVASVGTKV